MPNFLKFYTDREKALAIRNSQRKRNYSKTALYAPTLWCPEDDIMVLSHNMPDAELSLIIKHSVQAIQLRRCKLKKIIKEEAK